MTPSRTIPFIVATIFMDAVGFGIIMPVLPQLVMEVGELDLPHAIEVGGQQVKPFGIDVKASGGAAVFVLALAFFYFSNPAAGEDKPAPQETATPAPTGSPTDAPTGEPTGTPSDEPTDGPPDPAPPVQTAVQPGPLADPFGSQSPLPRGMSRARTYCSQCCNGNPIGCPSVGGGIAYSYQDAAQIAFQMCVENGGVDQYCYANMQQF